MAIDLLVYAGATVGALLPIVNPVTTAPVFISLTARISERARRQAARSAALYTGAILLSSFFAGSMILEVFGISLPVLRIGGGLVVTRIGFRMLEGAESQSRAEESQAGADEVGNFAFAPIAMPMLAGPGAIAATIAMATEAPTLVSGAGVVIGIVIVSCIAWSALVFSGAVLRLVGQTGMQVMTRLMGLILVCIGITFVATGAVVGLTTEPMLGVLRAFIADLQ